MQRTNVFKNIIICCAAMAALPTVARAAYPGSEPDARWRQEALERIRQIRQADLNIQVLDAQGQPLADTDVNVHMLRHGFMFGTNARTRDLLGTTADAPVMQDTLLHYYNKLVPAFALRPDKYWNAYRTERDTVLGWARDNKLPLRGHCLTWAPMGTPSPWSSATLARIPEFREYPDSLRNFLFAEHGRQLLATKGQITDWDVINHIEGWGTDRVADIYGSREIYADLITHARSIDPDAGMWVNEGQVLAGGVNGGYRVPAYLDAIKYLIAQGTPPDGIGFMSHFADKKGTDINDSYLTPPTKVLELLDTFGAVIPKLGITELDVTINSGDEQLQADYLRDILIAAFSHPNVVQILQWGYWEGSHYAPTAALWRTDWEPKPAARAFTDLIHKQWWTDVTVRTDSAGRAAVRGFLGDYAISITSDSQEITHTFTLEQGGAAILLEGDTMTVGIAGPGGSDDSVGPGHTNPAGAAKLYDLQGRLVGSVPVKNSYGISAGTGMANGIYLVQDMATGQMHRTLISR